MGLSYDVSGFDRFSFYAQAAKAILPGEMNASSEELAAQLQSILSELYPAGFLPYFEITTVTSDANTELAAIELKTNNKIFFWWEFGTNHPRPTYPINKQMLYFESQLYGMVFRPKTYYLTNKGITAHNRLPEMRARLKTTAKETWGVGLAAFFSGL